MADGEFVPADSRKIPQGIKKHVANLVYSTPSPRPILHMHMHGVTFLYFINYTRYGS